MSTNGDLKKIKKRKEKKKKQRGVQNYDSVYELWFRGSIELVLTGAVVGNRAARVRGVERGASWQGQETLRADASSRARNAVAVLASTWAHHSRAWPVSHAFVQATWLLTRTTVSPVESFNYERSRTWSALKVACFTFSHVYTWKRRVERRNGEVSENVF